MRHLATSIVLLSFLGACDPHDEAGSACASMGATLCARACDCGTSGCKISQGGATLSFDSEAACRSLFVGLGCQGPQPPPAQLEACEAALDTASCQGGALLVPASCDLDDDGPGSGPPDGGAPQEQPAEVLSRTPASSAADVDVATTVVVTFSAAMDPSTLTASTFTLRTSSGSVVAARVTAAVDRATLVPSSPLAFDTSYQVRLVGARDAEGHAVTVAEWSFRTARMPDRGAPVVVSQAPHRDETGVAESAAIKVTFSEDMDPASLTAATFTLARGSERVDGAVSVAGPVATFTPSAALAPDTSYTATVTTGARDKAGNALAAASTWSFRTADRTPPVVLEQVPAPSATAVERDAYVQLTFGEPTTVAADAVAVASGAAIPGKLTSRYDVASAKQIVTFIPDAAWPAAARVTVTVTGAKDAAGNAAAPISWSFTVRAATTMGAASMLNNGEETHEKPAVAVDGLGNGFALFARDDSMWAARYSAAAGRWYGAAKLATLASGTAAGDLRVLADASGRAIALWTETIVAGDHPLSAIKGCRYSVSSGWSAPVRLSAADGDATLPQAAMNAAGDAVIVYVEGDPQFRSYPLWALRYTPAGGWSAPERIEATLEPFIRIAVGIDGDGRASAFFIDDGALNVASADAGAAWGLPETELPIDAGDLQFLQVRMSAGGAAVAIWSGTELQAARRDAAGRWSDVVPLFTPSSWARPTDLELAVNDAGEAVALWHDDDTTLARMSPAGAWTKTTIPGRGWSGGVALDADGRATAVWDHAMTPGFVVPGSVYATRSVRGGAWSDLELLETSNLQGVADSAVAVNPAGVTFATWRQEWVPWGFRFTAP